MGWITSYWNNRPLQLILWIALILRLVATIFSKGYGMHDDHFLVIETAQSWLDGATYNNWFLERNTSDTPTILNFFYAGFHYLLFLFMETAGISDPQAKMYMVRLIHALWSLLIVYYGYKITQRLAGTKEARIAGLLLATLWFMPFFSVRNLVEMVCIPFLMTGYWLMIKAPGAKGHLNRMFFASLLFGLAFTFRFQTLIIPAGIGLLLLLRRKWLESLILAGGIILIIILTHGITDWIIWGKPFTELGEYISHNIHHRHDYTSSPWFTYILVILGVLIPPVSFFLFAGFFRTWKKYALLFVPTLIFIVFHSYYPNKQERFIMPVLPFFIMLGVVGWQEVRQRWGFLKKGRVVIRASWVFFWIINTALLFLFTTMYTKKARVESMVHLSRYENIGAILTEDVHRPYVSMLPLFYLQQWPEVLSVSSEQSLQQLEDHLSGHPEAVPSFVLFFGNEDLDIRVREMQQLLPGIVIEKVVEPGLPDRILHALNPVNANQTVYIYRNTEKFPVKKKNEQDDLRGSKKKDTGADL